MTPVKYDIRLLAAPSILGLRPTGVEGLSAALLKAGLKERLHCGTPVEQIPLLNKEYSPVRDREIHCLNPGALYEFSHTLYAAVTRTLAQRRFPFVLGGDCSILLGVMPALKAKGIYGIVFIDAHADFYEPERSVTGEVADMDLAIITGRGPELLANIDQRKPYVKDEHVIHIGQRDWEETRQYKAQDIRETAIKCFDLGNIRQRGIEAITTEVKEYAACQETEGFWIHFDTDSLSDDVNPAVDYRLPGGLEPGEAEYLIRHLLQTGKIAGISITCFNPKLDERGTIARTLVDLLSKAFAGTAF